MTLARSGSRRKLRVDLQGLETAFHDLSFETHYFLDRKTGAVARITGAVWRRLEDIYEELNRAGDHSQHGFDHKVREHNLADAERQALIQAHRVECGLGERYTALPPAHPHMELRDMEDFISTLGNPTLCEALEDAVRRPNPATHFLELLSNYPGQPESWRAFHDEQIKLRIHHWLADEGIEPLE